VGYDPRAIGQRVREEREKAGLSLAQLAAAAEITKAYLVRLETQGGNPSVEVVAKIAEALDLTAADLLDRPVIRYVEDDPTVPPSLRAFADEANLSSGDVKMLASIRWRGEKTPQTPERWRYVFQSLRMSREIDEEQTNAETN
jgi:transcriptional regulator with XRE-family HTH domain